MDKAALLFNGIKMSFAVVDHAFAWAQQSDGSLVAVFLKSEKEPVDGYIFPSDLDAAENLSDNKAAQTGLNTLIDSNIRILEHRASTDHIKLRTALLTDPTAEVLSEELSGCTVVFTGDTVTSSGTLTEDSINLGKWIDHSDIPVEMIRE